MTGLDAHLMATRDAFSLDIHLHIAPGETLALLGPNGAGKSTTVELLAGIAALDDGRIALGDRVLDHPEAGIFVPPESRRIGVVFQDYLLFEHLSIRDNVLFGPLAAGSNRAEATTVCDQWLAALDLESFADRRPSQLSGGQAQRVALARALATNPDLLLLDEALAALDVGSRSELRRVLAQHLREFKGPRLLITHDPTDAFLLADRIAVLENGSITQVGTSDDIRRRPATAYVAAVAGTNLLTGSSAAGLLTLDSYTHQLQAADTTVIGPAVITIHPTAISLHPTQPSGSPRNTWQTSVASVEPLGDTTRITLSDPLPLGVDITPGATAALGLAAGTPIWASVKATEIMVTGSSN